MQPGDLAGGPVRSYVSRVLVNGVQRPVVSVDFSSGLRSDLPSQISAASSSLSRSGTVVWAAGGNVSGKEPSAFRDFGQWRPQRGDKVVVFQGDGVQEWRRFTGLIDGTSGSIGSGMQSTIVVDVDRLSAPFECQAFLATMPPVAGGIWRNVGLSPLFFADAAMRAGGYYTTPRRLYSSILHVPLQGSLLPAVGTRAVVRTAGRYSGTGGVLHDNWGSPWGVAIGNFKAIYEPSLNHTPASPVQITMMATQNHSERADVFIHYGGSQNYIVLLVSDTRNAVVQRRVGSALVEVCRLTAAQMDGALTVTVVVRDGMARLRNDRGVEVTGPVSGLSNTPMSTVEVIARPGSRIAGVQVSHPEPWEEFVETGYERSARIWTGDGSTTTYGVIYASPRVERADADQVLQTLADATLSAMWIDEYGVLNFAPSDALRGRPPAQSINTANDVLSLSWSDQLLASASRVTVDYLFGSLKSSPIQSIELARGSAQQLTSETVVEDVYGPAADEDWIMPDESLTILGAGLWDQYNTGIGSFGGVVYTSSGETTSSAGLVTIITMQKTGLAEYTVKHETKILPADVVAETVTSPTSPELWPRKRDQALPVFRGNGLLKWIERETSIETNSVGPHLRVACGGFVNTTKANGVRDYLHTVVTSSVPRITGLEVVPDPRRQVGDVLEVRSDRLMGVRVRGMITSMEDSFTNDGHTQNISMDVLSVSLGPLSWAEWESTFPGTLTYEQWEAAQGSGQTYDTYLSQFGDF